ncbi:MAG: 2-hydroxyacid dehydrogenase [Veillonellales bacterium]
MKIIASVMPKWRFEAANVAAPNGWDIRFISPKKDEELIEACKEAECLLVPAGFQNVTANVLQHCQHLKLVQTAGAGFDGVDYKAAKAVGIPVANVPGQNAHSVAEYTVGLMIALQRQLFIADRETKAGRYVKIRQELFQRGLTEIAGSSVGLIGLGAIGQKVAVILSCLGAAVSYYSLPRSSSQVEASLRLAYKPLEQLLAESDIVSLHVPLTDKTRGLIGEKEMLRMKPTGLLVNTARGEIVDQAALAKVLEKGRIAGAAVDVLYPEPPEEDHPLLTLSAAANNRLLVTPHIAGVTVRSFRLMLTKALENIDRVLRGEHPEHVVNGL